jgi:hypothetical protein
VPQFLLRLSVKPAATIGVMSKQVTIGIIALACVSACGLITAFANFQMVEKVNERLPKEEQLAALGWYVSKTLRLHREYRRFYPNGHLLLIIRLLMALMIACLIICAWGFGFFAAPR